MAISDKISAKALEIHNEFMDFQAGTIQTTPIATEVRTLAMAAILGDGSEAWMAYMNLFAETPQELDHLIPHEDSEELQKRRAYLAANGMCSLGTTQTLLNNVGNRLDI